MKKLIGITVICVLFSSCEKTSRDCFMEERMWVKQHLLEFENNNRDALAGLPWTRQRILFSELSPEKKVQIWREKVEKVKQEGQYSSKVIQEFEDMVHLLSPSFFMDEPSQQKEEFEKITEQWEVRLKTVHNLTDEEILFLLYKWVTEEEYYDARALDKPIETKTDPSHQLEGGDNPLCDCAEGRDCITKKCDRDRENCRHPDRGCGQFGGYVCKHLCI